MKDEFDFLDDPELLDDEDLLEELDEDEFYDEEDTIFLEDELDEDDIEEFEDYDDDEDEDDYYEEIVEEPVQQPKSSGLRRLVSIILSLLILAGLGFGGYWVYQTYFTPQEPAQEAQLETVEESAPIEDPGSVEQQPETTEGIDQPATESDTQSEFKYQISHAGTASDTLNQMNVAFRDATAQFIQDGNLEAYQTNLNNIEAQRQASLAELSNHEPNELAELVAAQYQLFFNALNTAFGAQSTDQAVQVFNDWNNQQNTFNQTYTQTLTQMLDAAGIPWSQTETEAGLTITY